MMTTPRLTAGVAAFSGLLVAASAAHAQELPRLTIAVVEATTLQPVARATVIIDGRIQPGGTDSIGIFRLQKFPGGTHLFRVKKFGYAELIASAEVAPDSSILVDFALPPLATRLGKVEINAAGVPNYLNAFSRRQAGTTAGLFLGPIQLDSLKDQSLSQVLMARARGVSIRVGAQARALSEAAEGGGEYLVSTQRNTEKALRIADGAQQGAELCATQVYVDGMRVYAMQPRDMSMPGIVVKQIGAAINAPPQHDMAGLPVPFDLRSIPVSQIAAIEYYATAAETPAEFRVGSAAMCGTLVIWTRR
jgi:hypothetical protein